MDTVREQLDALWAEVREAGLRREISRLEELLNAVDRLVDADDDSFDHDRAELMRQRARVHFMRDEHKEGIRLGEQALDAYRALGDELGQARTIMVIGNCHNHGGNYADSIRYHSQAVEMFKSVGTDSDRGWGYLNLGVTYIGLGEFEQAVKVLEQSLEYFERHDDPRSICNLLSVTATPYFYMGDYSSAMRYSLRSYELAKRSDMVFSAGMSASNVSYIAFQVGAMKLAQQWASIAQEYRARTEVKTDAVNDELNMQMIDVRLDPSLERARSFEDLLLLRADEGHVAEVIQSVPFLADLYLELGENESAARLARTWFDRTEELQFRPGVLTLRRIRLSLDAKQRTDDELVSEGEAILAEAEDTKVSEEVEEALRLLAQIHRDRGEHDRSVSYYERYIEVRAKNAEIRSQHTTVMAQIQFDHERLDQLSDKQQELLSSVMPDEIVERLMHGEENIADAFDEASVMFLDLVSFTDLSSSVPPAHLIHLLNAVFSTCDDVVHEHGLTKIKTIGDSYLAVSGLPHSQDDHALRMANAAVDLTSRLKDLQVTMPPELGDTSWVDNVGNLSIRIGLHCGPVVAGVIGRHRAQYDVWGDTVNTASRMESSGEPDRIHISEDFAMKIAQGASPEFEGTDVVIRQAPYTMRLRGTQKIKGKGDMKTFWLEGA